jgi:hypothetical protein
MLKHNIKVWVEPQAFMQALKNMPTLGHVPSYFTQLPGAIINSPLPLDVERAAPLVPAEAPSCDL